MSTFTAVVDRSITEYASSSKCLIYLDPLLMERHGLAVGELIRIRTQRGRSVLARLAEPLAQDQGAGIVRLDRFLRQATKARLNETVELEPFPDRAVRKVVLIPAIDVFSAHNLVDHLRRTFADNKTPVSPGSVLYATFPHSVAGTTYTVHAVEEGPGVITPDTEIQLDHAESHTVEGAFDVTFEDVGGLDNQIALVRELVQLPLQMPYVYRQLGISPPRGIIFYGPPGTGKTHLARAIANEVQARFYYINGPDIVGTLYGETESNLRRIFNEAAHHAPSIILIDELDALAPKRGETGAHSDTRAVTQLLALLDGLKKVEGVVVIGTTNRIEAIDTALRRPGRFDREVFFGPPDLRGRYAILQIHTREMPLSDEALDYLPQVAEATVGYVGADLMELCREAGLEALRRSKTVMQDHLGAFRLQEVHLEVTKEDFDAALSRIRPSAMREIMVTIPDTRWEDIGGLEDVKGSLREAIELPLKRPEVFAAMGITPPKGILLYGPPGCGKTLLAKAVANECQVNFLAIEGPEIFTKWLGESEEAVRHIFRVARQVAPAIVFFDQLDAIAPRRGGDTESRTSERVVNQLLTELDGVEPLSGIMVLAATNRIDLIDPSVLRPGRFDTHIYVPLPDATARREILTLFLKDLLFSPELTLDEILRELVDRTEGFSGAELKAICDEAKIFALRRTDFAEATPVRPQDFQRAMDKVVKARDSYTKGGPGLATDRGVE